MSDIDEKNYPIFIDDSSLFAFPHINLEKEFRCSLEQSLRFLKCDKEKWRRFLADNDLAYKMAEHGLRVNEYTDKEWLAYTLRRLDIWTLEDDLEFMLFAQKINWKLDADSYEARLASEMGKCGLELTSDTDIKQLAETVKQLGILEKIL